VQGRFRFAALQSALAARALSAHGKNPQALDTFYVLLNLNGGLEGSAASGDIEKGIILSRSDAVSFVLIELGGFWRLLGKLFRLLPRSARDWVYRLVARNRYRIFGRSESCPLPSAATRSRFLDQ
jgi:predicted DCC family thiol-disulfide oxidoreductase YuxK